MAQWGQGFAVGTYSTCEYKKWQMIFTDTPKLDFSFPIGLYSQLFEPREIPFGQLVHKCAGK